MISLLEIIKSPKAIVGFLISVIGLYWAFKDFHFYSFKESLKQINVIYLLLAAMFLWSSVWLRSLRWKWLFKESSAPTISSLYRAELIGHFGNNVLPLRLGELLRAYIVGKENNLTKSFVFGTVVLERITDLFTLLLFSLILLLIYPFDSIWINEFINNATILMILLIIILLIFNRFKLKNPLNKSLNIVNQILEGLLSISVYKIIPVISVSILIWSIYLLDVYLIQKAFQFDINWVQSLIILVISSIALSIPSAPGMIGTFHVAVKYTMVDLFAFSSSDGDSFAILMHAYGYILLTSLGAYYFIKSQFNKDAIDSVVISNAND